MTLETLLRNLTPDTPITAEEMSYYKPIDKILADIKPYRTCILCGRETGNIYKDRIVAYCLECLISQTNHLSNENQKNRRRKEKREVSCKCVICGSHYMAESKRAKYCPLCRSYADAYNQKYRKSKRGTVKEYIEKMREICDSEDVINIKHLIKYGGE